MTSKEHPQPAASNLLNLLSCPECGLQMTLLLIKPGEAGFDRLTFVCRECHTSETIITAVNQPRQPPSES
ncbi:hypothetical protein ACSVBT_15010 [Afipia sp. TerB]